MDQAQPYYFFDEVQNVEGWEVFIRHLHDRRKIVCLTGSNASLLSKELATRLTGRSLHTELFPFSYREYIAFKQQEPNTNTFLHYIEEGGFPEIIRKYCFLTPAASLPRSLLFSGTPRVRFSRKRGKYHHAGHPGMR